MASSIDSSSGLVIKNDRAGRTRYSLQYKNEVLEAYEASSLSAPCFARQCGIKYPTFAAWVARRRRSGGLKPEREVSAKPAFLLAELPGAASFHGLEVRLPGGAVARAAGDAEIRLLAELLRHLA
jgi:transposase-like protein